MFAYGVGADGDAAQSDQAIGYTCYIDQTRGLKKCNFDTEFRGYPWATANRWIAVFFIILFFRGYIFPADGDREQTIPVDVGHGVNKLPLAFGRKKREKKKKEQT